MAFMIDDMLDAALAYLDNVTALHICSQEPTTLTEATTTYTLGNKASPTINAAEAGDTSGRKRVVAAISDGTQTGAGTASHYALVSGTELIATNSFASTFDTSGSGTFTTTAFDVTVQDAVSE